MERAVLYLDVDGVMNPWAARVPPATWSRAWRRRRTPVGEINVWTNTHLGEALAKLDVEIVWATTWVNHREDLEWFAAHSGLPQGLDAVRYDPAAQTDLANCGKLPGVIEHLDGSERLVLWADDDLGPGDLAYLSSRQDAGMPAVAFSCDPRVGLTESTVREMAEMLERYRSERRGAC